MKVIWAPLALDRAAEIARYIAADRPAAADRWIDGLMRLAAGLSRAPKRGRIVPEVGRADLREILYGRYRVIYRLEPKRVAVLTGMLGKRSLSASWRGATPRLPPDPQMQPTSRKGAASRAGGALLERTKERRLRNGGWCGRGQGRSSDRASHLGTSTLGLRGVRHTDT